MSKFWNGFIKQSVSMDWVRKRIAGGLVSRIGMKGEKGLVSTLTGGLKDLNDKGTAKATVSHLKATMPKGKEKRNLSTMHAMSAADRKF